MNQAPSNQQQSVTAPAWLPLADSVRSMFDRAWKHWRAPAQMTAREWADEYLYLSPDAGSARPGKYRSSVTPWLWAIQEVIDDPTVNEVVVMKSSQIGYTIGVVMAYVGKRIHLDPCPIVVMFPTGDDGRNFNEEKFTPIVDITPALRAKIDNRSRKSGNRATFKKFPGGFAKFVGSNSPRSVKSSSAPVLIVEEPDDASSNVKGQGDSITLLGDRAKTYTRYKKIMGGTPTLKDLSSIESAYKKSDQRKLFVPCHHCGEEHVLAWEHLKWQEESEIAHEIYGKAQPETAVYYCPHCGGEWRDYDKNENVTRAAIEKRWKPTAAFNGVAGFGYISELYVPWHKSAFSYLVRRYLEAKHESDNGDDSKLIAFYNSTLGLPYEYGGKRIETKELAERSLDYAERVVPRGGLILTVGIDTQHDRFAIVIRAWGRGEESWLVYWGEIYGDPNDKTDGVWTELEQLVYGPFQHESGRALYAAAVSIDSGDGATTDGVYGWVREMRRKYSRVQTMPTKGASDNMDKEIFSTPKQSIDHKTPTKASKYGLRIFVIGTNKAKDLLLGGERQRGRIHLTGDGPGRFHVYKSVRADYWDQFATSEVKAPSRRLRGRMVWQQRSGRRNEALDCEVGALHASRALKLHIVTPAQWDAIEQNILQADLFTVSEAMAPDTAAVDSPEEQKSQAQDQPRHESTADPAPRPQVRRPGGFVNRWRGRM